MSGKRNYRVRLFPDPDRKIMAFDVNADTVEIDGRGNAVFKTDGRVVGLVSNPAYQYVREFVSIAEK